MTCLECKKKLSYLDHRESIELFQTELCATHRRRLERLVSTRQIPREAAILYYGLIQAGIKPMLAWWDGKKTVDLAVSRVRLNIEIDTGYESLTLPQALNDLEASMHSFEDGFTTIRIPGFLIRASLRETVENVLCIVEGLKLNVRVV